MVEDRSHSGVSSSTREPVRENGSTALRMMLGVKLRRLRESNGISRDDAGDAIRASAAKISRLELGRVGSKERDVAELLTLYGVGEGDERSALLELGRRARRPSWWQSYGELLPSWFETYVGLEQSAKVIRTYETQFVPGLLQTRDYARAVTDLGSPDIRPTEVERRVELRLRRQEILREEPPPKLWAVVDEAALRRPIGGVRVQIGQLEHLLHMATLPHVTIQVVTLRSGGHAAAGGPFSILRFADPDVADVVYLEQLTSAVYLDKPTEVERYLAVMTALAVQAEPVAGTARILRSLIDEWRAVREQQHAEEHA